MSQRTPFLLVMLLVGLWWAGAREAAAQAQPKQPPAPSTGAPAATGKKTFVLRLPPGGKYLVTIPESRTPPVEVTNDQVTLDIPSGAPKFILSVVDEQNGYALRRELDAATVPAEVPVTAADFKLVHLVRVHVTGKGDKPVANAMVVIEDAAGKSHQTALEPARQGEVLIADVAQGKAKLSVYPASASPTTKEVNISLQKGEQVQAVNVGLPEVTGVVDAPVAANAPSNATANAPGGTGEIAPPHGAPVERQPPPEPGGAWTFFQTLLGFIILGIMGFGVYLVGRKQGWTIEGAMSKLGVQPQTLPDTGPGRPGPSPAPTPPPPVVADPNRCQFCGELKDPATGSCACTLAPGAAAPFGAPASAAPYAAASGGPRLVATGGVYMGEIFPLHGEAVLGRDPMNSIPLDRDTTVSRRHARLVPEGGGYRLVDEGSSNGTYVNGARVTDAPLNPGDEINIGGTRFRFEV